MKKIYTLLDCTLRDGGYYNNWDFPEEVINQYLFAMVEAGVDVVELGMRSLINDSFKGACAFTTDEFINSLAVPDSLKIGVMINASELVGNTSIENVLNKMFPNDSTCSPVQLVRIASHVHEFADALPAVSWLKEHGFEVGFNLMQIVDCSQIEIEELSKLASKYDIDVLYFADSMGSMTPEQTSKIISWLRNGWHGELGIHTHDNLGLALSNTLRAMDDGVTWVDATVTGMGRGPGNARTEELVIEVSELRKQHINMIPLMQILGSYFKPMQYQFGWGTNPYYYLAGKHGIHPSYIQKMQGDSRFSEEDILAVINHLREEGGKKFSLKSLDAARHFYHGDARGNWCPKQVLEGRDVLILGTGPGVAAHRIAIERFIRKQKPVVLALNTQTSIDDELINYRVACHPIRLLADCDLYASLPQPLITPYSMLPENVRSKLLKVNSLDFGLQVQKGFFDFKEEYAIVPTSMVILYALAVANSGKPNAIYLAGMDGYPAADNRNSEMDELLRIYSENKNSIEIVSLTPTVYKLRCLSIYGF